MGFDTGSNYEELSGFSCLTDTSNHTGAGKTRPATLVSNCEVNPDTGELFILGGGIISGYKFYAQNYSVWTVDLTDEKLPFKNLGLDYKNVYATSTIMNEKIFLVGGFSNSFQSYPKYNVETFVKSTFGGKFETIDDIEPQINNGDQHTNTYRNGNLLYILSTNNLLRTFNLDSNACIVIDTVDVPAMNICPQQNMYWVEIEGMEFLFVFPTGTYFYALNMADKTWVKVPSTMSLVSGYFSERVGSFIYFFQGTTAWKFNVTTFTASSIGAGNLNVTYPATFVYQNKIYIYGGKTGGKTESQHLWMFDPEIINRTAPETDGLVITFERALGMIDGKMITYSRDE